MLHQVSIAISNWIHAPKTLEVLGLAAPTPTGFAEIVSDDFPILNQHESCEHGKVFCVIHLPSIIGRRALRLMLQQLPARGTQRSTLSATKLQGAP